MMEASNLTGFETACAAPRSCVTKGEGAGISPDAFIVDRPS